MQCKTHLIARSVHIIHLFYKKNTKYEETTQLLADKDKVVLKSPLTL